MRITRDTLLNIARDTASQRARGDRSVIAVFLCGSLLDEDYLLGGTVDIDLFFVHDDTPAIEREILRLTDEVHLDIAHHPEKEYRQARQLRLNPWLGPTLNSCKVLYDLRHFMDFTQASVRGQFDRPDNIFGRARKLMEQARQIWLKQQTAEPGMGPQQVNTYLRSVMHAANAIAGLSGPPLSERRFLLTFPHRAEAVGRPGLYAGLLGLLGAPRLAPDSIAEWLPAWHSAYQALPSEKTPARLHPDRRLYYARAFETILEGPHPEAVLWPLLRTWTLTASLLPPSSPDQATWYEALAQLGLQGPDFTERIEALDAYLDLIDETLETWARINGAWPE
jgi:hypothetical protein